MKKFNNYINVFFIYFYWALALLNWHLGMEVNFGLDIGLGFAFCMVFYRDKFHYEIVDLYKSWVDLDDKFQQDLIRQINKRDLLIAELQKEKENIIGVIKEGQE